MPAERTTMRQVRELLRLKLSAGLKVREIARRLGIAPSTVRQTLTRFEAAGLSWPLPAMTDAALEAVLYRPAGRKQGQRRRPEPDWAAVHRELKRRHVTLQIVWDEYIAEHPDGYRYSRFCDLYRGFAEKLPVTMRQSHTAGDKLFVDYRHSAFNIMIEALSMAAGGKVDLRSSIAMLRERNRQAGRIVPSKAVGSTLLLKGLEAQHVVILDADQPGAAMSRQHLYVALTRGARSVHVFSRLPILPA